MQARGCEATQQHAPASASLQHARLAAEHARRAGDQGLRARALALYIAALMHGTTDAPALTRELDAVASEDVGPYVASLLMAARGEIRRLEGDLEGARGPIRDAIERFKAMRINTMLASCVNWLGWSELAGGDPATALPGLLEIDAELEKAGERSFRSTIQATTAEIYARLGEIERARAAVRLAEDPVAREDHLTLVGICADAIAHADRMDVPFLRGHARLELGLVLRARGRNPEASAAGLEALAIFRGKGDQPRICEALAFLGEPPPEPR
jgi:tetratricopeptide (TPR) repeat protein